MEIKDFEQKISIDFKNPEILLTALTHRSYLNENKSCTEHNERLEFLGDAVLEIVVTEYLFNNFPNPEGELTNLRSALVKTESISSVAKELGVESFMLLSKGEANSFGRSRQLILANAFEAIVGAIYLDQGLDKAREFIVNNLIVHLDKILKDKLYIDSKSQFQELAQEKEGLTPHYEVISTEGPDHNKKFTVGVFVGDKQWGIGIGPSKQAAQQKAATKALEEYRSN